MALREVGLARTTEDARMLEAVGRLCDAVRERVLERRSLVGVALTRSESRDVTAHVKRLAVAELEVALGFSVTEARQAVGVALAGGTFLGVVLAALRRGEVSWPQVRACWQRAARLSDDQRLLVALALFGTDPSLAAEERLDPDGGLRGGPWPAPSFAAALERESTACEGEDVAGERERRRAAYRRRHVSVRVHDDGTATMTITGPAAPVVAAGQRVDAGARSLRRAGDGRTLDQGRFDVTMTQLMYGTITVPAASRGRTGAATGGSGPDDPARADAGPGHQGGVDHEQDVSLLNEVLTPPRAANVPVNRDEVLTPPDPDVVEQVDEVLAPPDPDVVEQVDEVLAPPDPDLLARVINALPPVHLQVVVPVDALRLGYPICSGCAGPLDPGRDASGMSGLSGGSPPCRPPGAGAPRDDVAMGVTAVGVTAVGVTAVGDTAVGDTAAGDTAAGDTAAGDTAGRGLVGEVLGASPLYLTPGHLRELALLPGTTLYRLLADPADGRLVERTIAGYRPDTDMRRQVVAADVYSRAPGSRLGVHAGELDHVVPYGWAGGPTGELNLALLAKRAHRMKTDGDWTLELGARRDVTVTTMLRQICRTRVHDYRQYLHGRDVDDLDDLDAPEDAPGSGRRTPGLEVQLDRANRLVYAALAQSPRAHHGPGPTPFISLTCTGHDGQVRSGVSPHHPTLDDLLGQPLAGQAWSGKDA